MKIRRNALCPCGSGKKFKRCCGEFKYEQTSPQFGPSTAQTPSWVQESFRAHKAAENVRQQQQGYGQPIISWVDHGFRLVAVGNEVFWDTKWLVFPDFLFYFLKRTFGFEWGARGKKEKSPHPIFRWLPRVKEYTSRHGSGQGRVKSGPLVGFFSGTLHLAYALYLIAHNDQIPKRLLRRLRDSDTFMPAYYEALVGAALAVAGFDIASAETKATSKTTPEFRVKSKCSGKVYEVEAKRKERWTASTIDVNSEAFRKELERYVRDQIYNASRKKLRSPIFSIELSIPTLHSEADWRAIVGQAERIIREAENMTVDGEPMSSAFVVITNHTFLANEDVTGDPSFAFLQPLCIPDYPVGRTLEVEDALEGYDKYRDVFRMMEAWRLARTIPITFDGTPPELLTPDGQPGRTVQIGDMLVVPDGDGNEVVARVEEIVSMGDQAVVAVHDLATNRRWLAKFPLTEGEIKAAARFTDAIFGKDNASRRLRENDIFGLYDWLLAAYADADPQQLAKLIRKEGASEQYEALSHSEARVRLAREYTKRIWVASQQRKEGRPQTEQT